MRILNMKIVLAIFLIALPCSALPQSQQHSPTQSKNSKLSTDNGPEQPAPTANLPTTQEITEAIANGIERADKKHDASQPPIPPDNSGWWFNLFLVVFTGLLVVVGGAQCYLIFWTLKATEIAAIAAKDAAEALPKIERAYVFIGTTDININSTVITTLVGEGAQRSTRTVNSGFTIVNHGKTPAILTEIFGELHLVNDVKEITTIEGTPIAPGTIIEASGDKRFHLDDYEADHAKLEAASANTTPKLIMTGKILYDDVLSKHRETGFCMKYDFRRREFRPMLETDRNYWT